MKIDKEKNLWKFYYDGYNDGERTFNSTGQVGVLSNSINVGDWTHFAISRNGTTYKIFANGELVHEQVFSTAGSSPLEASDVWIGESAVSIAGGQAGWNGYFDELRLTNGVSRYNNNFTVYNVPFPTE